MLEKSHRVLDQLPAQGQIEDLVKLIQPVLGHADQKLIQTGIMPEVGPVADIGPAGDILDSDILVALFHGFGDQGFTEQFLGPADPFILGHLYGTLNALWQSMGHNSSARSEEGQGAGGHIGHTGLSGWI